MLIKVKVIPGSKKTEIIKKKENEFLITIKEKPEKGRANKEIFIVLADYFNLSRSRIRLIKGFKKRNKIYEIIDL
jgi:uncharacterized protein